MTRKIAALSLACGLTLQGCGLDEKAVPEALIGPSELGLSLRVLATPDVVLADGIQTSVIEAILQDQNGKTVAGRGIVFTIMDDQGRTAEIGQLTSTSGARVYGSTTVPTNSAGVARVIYTTPERRDFTADARIRIGARPVGTDANGAPNWTVSLELRSAEPRRFPGGGVAPTCSFIYAPNAPVQREGAVLRFTSTSSAVPPDYIVRYEWYFGDGSGGVTGAEGIIDVQHPFPFAGTFEVTHIVTGSSGAQSACSRTITIVP